jgi:GTP cyclohydrolase II
MFSYVDPSIYDLLLEQGKVVTIGEDGQPPTDNHRPGTDRINLLGPIPLPVAIAGQERELRWYPFVRRTQHEQVLDIAKGLHDRADRSAMRELLTSQMTVNSFLVYGDFEHAEAPLVRVHSCCMTGEVFGSLRCECAPQLDAAFERIVSEGCGAIVYMASHEGRGIGLWAKGITYLLQDMGRDTYDANRDLNLPVDSRDFRDAAMVLLHFLAAPARIRLLSNNPHKRDDLTSHGIEIAAEEPLVVGVGRHNLRYMQAKRDNGHAIDGLPRDRGSGPSDD